MKNDDRIERLLDGLLGSKRNAAVDRAIVSELIRDTLPRYKSEREAVKAVKKKLHISHGVFFPEDCYSEAEKLIDQMERMADISIEQSLEFSGELMRLHMSTGERLDIIEEFYGALDEYTGGAKTVMDIGCGFNPFAWPFMKLDSGCRYLAYDIDARALGLVSRYFGVIGAKCSAETLDASKKVPGEAADIAFTFKLLPVIEQLKKGSAAALINGLNAAKIVITFPVKSVSGREKGMEKFYSGWFEQAVHDTHTVLDRQIIGNELVYIVKHNQINTI